MPRHSVIPSASGYPVYDYLRNPVFGTKLVARFRLKGITNQFTTSGMDGLPKDLASIGTEVVMRREPEAQIFDYQKNQTLTHSKLSSDTFRLVIGRGKYWSLKLDLIDWSTIPNIQAYVTAFLNDAADRFDQAMGREIMYSIPWEVSPYNKGVCAGLITGAYNLGNIGTPVQITPENFAMKLMEMNTVLSENKAQGPYVAILPLAIKPLLYHPDSPLAAMCCSASGDRKSIIFTNGEVWPDIAGFKLIFAHYAPQYTDPVTQKTTYAIIAGRADATLAVTKVVANRIVDQNEESFDKYWQGLQIYGFKVIKPEALAVMYATLS